MRNPKIWLMPLAESHLASTFQWLNCDHIQEGFLIEPPPDYESHVRWFRSSATHQNGKNFAVESENGHVGNCGLKSINNKHHTCELFIYLGPENHGKGYASAALKELCSFAKVELGMRKIHLHVRTDNIPALFLYLKNDFYFESILRGELDWRGKSIDVYRLSKFL
jgi:RimJ/RimL family protein N-acetyltransferase